MGLRDHTIEDYRQLLTERLPEYSLQAQVLPEAGRGAASAIRLVLGNQALAKYGVIPAPPHPKQPEVLVITGNEAGKKRLDDIKHFVNKRNLIIKFLKEDENAIRAGLVLKGYRRWDDFTVGTVGGDDADVVFAQLAALKKSVEKLSDSTQRDWFRLRRFLHMTTTEQKRQMVINLLNERPAIYALDTEKQFEKNRFFIKFRDPSRAPDYRLELNSYTELCVAVTGYENGLSGYVERKMHAIADWLHTKYVLPERIAAEIARVRSEAPEDLKLYVQADSLQRKFVEAQQRIIDDKASTLHGIFKSIKEAIVGKHVRTHPVRAARILVGHLVRGVYAVKEKLDSISVPPPPADDLDKILKELEGVAKRGGDALLPVIAEEAARKLGADKPTPQWLADLGWGPTAMDLDKRAWDDIEEHVNSIEKWENAMKTALASIGSSSASGSVTCADVDVVLRSHAKILYHLVKAKDTFKVQAGLFDELVQDLDQARVALLGQEERVKRLSVEFEAKGNAAYKLLENAELGYYSVVSQMRQAASQKDEELKRNTVMPADQDRPGEFVDSPEQD